TVIGVVDGPSYPPDTDLWRPITADEREDDDRELRVVARLLPQQSATLFSPELAALASGRSSGARTAWAEDMQRTEVKGVERALVMLFGSAMLILLIACANVAALIAARGQDHAAEIAVREALGASRGQLVVQLLSESVVLAIAGGIAGLLLGRWTLGAIIAIAPASLPRLTEISLDMRVVGLGLVATIAVGIVVGLAPAFRASRPGRDAQSHGAGSTRVTGRSHARRVLVVAQGAMAGIITGGAGVLARRLVNMINTPNGFDPERLISVELYLRGAVRGDSRPLFRELTAAAASLNGVSSAAVAMRLPQRAP